MKIGITGASLPVAGRIFTVKAIEVFKKLFEKKSGRSDIPVQRCQPNSDRQARLSYRLKIQAFATQ
jgi:hypothetical protein